MIHLRKKFETLPYFVSFSQFSPIPKAKDTKQNYSNHPIATGPYMFKSFTQGTKLELVKNPNWDASTDPVRHQYLDGYTFNFGVDSVKTQQAILASNGPDATTLNWDQIDAQFVDQVTGAKKSQFVYGPSSCTVAINLDTRKMPLRGAQGPRRRVPVRPGAQGRRPDHAVRAAGHTLIPPQVPGHLDYTLPGLSGTGKGDPAAAKKMLADAGKTGFQLDFYYTNDDPIAQQVNLVRKQALEAAGFKVHDMGVARQGAPLADRRPEVPDQHAAGTRRLVLRLAER